jgi:hypothetical protein
MLQFNEKKLETILQDRQELAPEMPKGHTITSIQLHNQDGIVIALPIDVWYGFTAEMRTRIASDTPVKYADAFIAQIISSIEWVEYAMKDEEGLTRLVVPTWRL